MSQINWLEFNQDSFIAGIDEVGRGPWAGPIVVGLCFTTKKINIFPEGFLYSVKDSKKLSSKQRQEILKQAKNLPFKFKIFSCEAEDIDKYGVGVCNKKLAQTAIDFFANQMTNQTERENGMIYLDLIMGFKPETKNDLLKISMLPKAESASLMVALASIYAKEYRDNLMSKLSEKYPDYLWEKNAGYGTSAHINAIKKLGITPEHRKSFLKNLKLN